MIYPAFRTTECGRATEHVDNDDVATERLDDDDDNWTIVASAPGETPSPNR